MTTIRISPLCLLCEHLKRGSMRCTAFPGEDGIPGKIWLGGYDHRVPFSGDGGVQFEPREDATPEDIENWEAQ